MSVGSQPWDNQIRTASRYFQDVEFFKRMTGSKVIHQAHLWSLIMKVKILIHELLCLSLVLSETLLEQDEISVDESPSLIRVKRQFQASFNRKIPDLSGIEQGCKTTGYETREREICEEIEERICLVSFHYRVIFLQNNLSNEAPW